MPIITQESVVSDDALEAPLVLAKNLETAVAAAKEVIEVAKKYDQILGTTSKTSDDHRQRTKELTDEQKALASITKQVAAESAKQSDAYQILLTRKRELVQMTKNKQEIDAEEARLTNANTSSLDRLSQALTKNKQEYAKLASEKERTSAAGKKLLKTIQEQNEALEKLKPNLKIVTEHGESMAESLEKIELGGAKAANVLNKFVEASLTGWGLLAAGIGVATEGMKLFFERTEVGEVLYENALNQLSVRFDQFKNHLAQGIQESLPEDIGTDKRKQRLRRAQLANLRGQIRPNRDNTEIEERIKELEKEYALTDAIEKLAVIKKEQTEEEAKFTVERVDKLGKAAKLELEARESADRSAKERLDAITKADQLYREVQKRDYKLAEDRARLAISDIYLRAQGRDLRAGELLQTQKLIASVEMLTVEFDKASKRRVALINNLKKELAKDNSYTPDFSLYEKDWEQMLNSIKKLNDDAQKTDEDMNKQELKEQQEQDKELFAIQEKEQQEAVEKANARWDKYLEKKKERALKEQELIKVGADASVKIVDDQFEHQIGLHENYIQRITENYHEEMQLAEGNKIAQAQLTTQFREREKKEQQEIIKMKRREAQFNRDITELNIILKTAEAVMADVAKYPESAGQPFVTFDEAIGAAQLIAIMAKPLPSYDVGTTAHKGGPALVHPGELLTFPHGESILTPSIPTIMELPRNTQVDTQDETMRLLALAGLNNSFLSDRSSINNNQKVLEEMRGIRQELKNQRNSSESLYAAMSGYYKFKKQSDSFAKKILIEKFGK